MRLSDKSLSLNRSDFFVDRKPASICMLPLCTPKRRRSQRRRTGACACPGQRRQSIEFNLEQTLLLDVQSNKQLVGSVVQPRGAPTWRSRPMRFHMSRGRCMTQCVCWCACRLELRVHSGRAASVCDGLTRCCGTGGPGRGHLGAAPSGSFPSEGFLCPVVSQHGLVLRVRRGRAWFQGVLPGVPRVCVCVCV